MDPGIVPFCTSASPPILRTACFREKLMKAVRALAVLVLVLLVSPSCSESPTSSPATPTPEASLIGSLLKPTGLLRCSNLPYAQSTATIGRQGGSISAGPHTLVIQPHGLQFLTPASLTMSYSNCSLLGLLLPKEIAYTDDNLNILSYLLSLDNLLSKRVTGKVNHFSNYVVAW